MDSITKICCFFLVLISFASCSEDDSIPEGFIELRYDAENVNAPVLPGNTYEAAVKFPSSISGNDANNRISSIGYFIQDKPATAKLNIYFGGQQSPGSLVYSENVINATSAFSWNTHVLNDTIVLTGNEPLWVSIEYSHSGFSSVVGCDQGPAVVNGDWLYDGADGSYIPLSERSGTSINWNIRTLVELAE